MLARELSAEATPEELADLRQLLSQHPLLDKIKQELKIKHDNHNSADIQKALASFSAIDALIQDKNPLPGINPDTPLVLHPASRRFKKLAIVIAAASVVLLVGTWFVFQYTSKKDSNNNPAEMLHEIAALPKTIREISLPDGSIIHLNEDSKIAYNDDFNDKTREIWLTGEAFFDVAKNKDKPFVIHTGKVNIKVLGTAFNVRFYRGEQTVETSLVRGSVEITVTDDPTQKYLLAPNQKLVIPIVEKDTAESAVVKTEYKEGIYSSLQPVQDVYSKDTVIAELSWIEGKLAFSKTSFKDLAVRLEKRFNTSFVFEDKRTEDLEFTGVFYRQTLAQALNRLSIAAPFRYRLEDSTVYIFN